ncbi:MAG: hypothetical protein ACRCY6_04485, partial [Bacteroidales bacterium]
PEIDVAADCPEAVDTQGESIFQACYKRDSKEGNWEAWLLDNRDCKFYRTVRMPDNRWWFAQNLKYVGSDDKILFHQAQAKDYALMGLPTDVGRSERLRSYYCPTGPRPSVAGAGVHAPAARASGTFRVDTFVASLNACEVYGVLYPAKVAVTTDGFSNDTLSSVLNRPHLYPVNDTTTSSTIRGVCPKGWAVPSKSDMGRMFNFADYKSDTTGGQCPSTGQNNSGTGVSITTSRCQHLQAAAAPWVVRSNFLRELMATSLAPAVKLGGTRTAQNAAGTPGWNYPDTTRMYSTHSEPVWSYFGQENAGTDRYGFALLPAGLAYTWTSSYFISFGLNTLLATSNAHSTNLSEAAISKAYPVFFVFAYNPVQPGFAGHYRQDFDLPYNVSVRCVKVKTNL